MNTDIPLPATITISNGRRTLNLSPEMEEIVEHIGRDKIICCRRRLLRRGWSKAGSINGDDLFRMCQWCQRPKGGDRRE
jgi:hypothetical protein